MACNDFVVFLLGLVSGAYVVLECVDAGLISRE